MPIVFGCAQAHCRYSCNLRCYMHHTRSLCHDLSCDANKSSVHRRYEYYNYWPQVEPANHSRGLLFRHNHEGKQMDPEGPLRGPASSFYLPLDTEVLPHVRGPHDEVILRRGEYRGADGRLRVEVWRDGRMLKSLHLPRLVCMATLRRCDGNVVGQWVELEQTERWLRGDMSPQLIVVHFNHKFLHDFVHEGDDNDEEPWDEGVRMVEAPIENRAFEGVPRPVAILRPVFANQQRRWNVLDGPDEDDEIPDLPWLPAHDQGFLEMPWGEERQAAPGTQWQPEGTLSPRSHTTQLDVEQSVGRLTDEEIDAMRTADDLGHMIANAERQEITLGQQDGMLAGQPAAGTLTREDIERLLEQDRLGEMTTRRGRRGGISAAKG